MTHCPYYKNKEVFDGFNKMVKAFGGKPLTEEEFRDSDLRNQRQGSDYSAMEAAYKVYDRNGGNFLDKTPDGKPSILYQTLLDYFGDEEEAINAKANVYSDEFINWFGDWEKYAPKSDATKRLIDKLEGIVNSKSRFAALAKLMLDNNALPYNLKYFKIDNNRDDVEGHSAMWHSLVNLIEVLGNKVSEEEINKALLHELIHYNTESLLSTYKTSPEKVPQSIRQNIKELYSIIDYAKKYITGHFNEKKFREIAERQNKNIGSRVFYAFDNQGSVEIDEFISEIFTNPGLQEILNEITYKETKQTLWDRIKECIQNIFGISINRGSVLEEALKASTEFITKAKEGYNSVSKVVDENGEPLVVWHGGAKNITAFKLPNPNSGLIDFTTLHNIEWADREGYNITEEQRNKYNTEGYIENATKPVGVYFAKDQVVSRSYFGARNEEDTGLYAVYLNIKNPNTSNKQGKQMIDDAGTVKDLQNAIDNGNDGVIIEDIRDYGPNDKERMNFDTGEFAVDATTDYVVFNPNQIKHVKNLGTFDPNDPNIYKLESKTFTPEQQLFDNCNITNFFGQNLVNILISGGTVNVKDIISNILSNELVGGLNINLAKVLQIHNIPVLFNYNLDDDTIAATKEERNTGVPIIYINPNTIQLVTNRYAAIAILHEVVHAVTLNAIHNPKTKEQLVFKDLNKKIRERILKLYEKNRSALGDYDSSLYALESEEEFAAVFITDSLARSEFIALAAQADKNRSNFLNNIKRFINSIVKLFVNKTLFEQSNKDLIEEYERTFRDYLNNLSPITKNSIPSNSVLKGLYDSMDELALTHEQIVDNTKALDHYEKYLNSYALRLFDREYTFKNNREERDVSSDPRYSDIIDSLKIRVNTLRTSDIDLKTRIALINATKTLISLFENSNIPKYVAITSMLKYVTPQILDDIREMRNRTRTGTFNSKDYMYNMHGNFGMYFTVADMLNKILTDRVSLNELMREMNKTLDVDKQLTTDDIDNLVLDINNLKSAADTGVKLAEQQLKIIVAGESGTLATVGKSVGSLEMGEYLASINSENPVLPNDIKSIWKYIGTADSSENESIRALSHIVKKALDAADDEALDRGINLLKVAKKLKFGEKVTDIYETDDKGRTTGYIVRDLNWGKFYMDYDKFMESLNEELGLPKDNRVAPIDKEQLVKWNEARNKFLDEHCERKYKSEYYKLWNEVPQSVKESLDSYNIQINAIIEGIKDKNGNSDYSKLTDDEWVELNRLWEAKALLRSDYNEYGQLRTEGDPDYEAAKALLNLYAHLYPKDVLIKKNEDAWNAERNRVIEECGGHDKYIEYIKTGKAEGFDSAKFDKWEARNTRWEYIQDEDGNPIIFEKINQLLHGDKPQYGKEYDDLKEQYDSILKPYRDLRGIVNVLDIPDAVLNKLGDLSKRMAVIRKEEKSKNPRLAQFLKQRAELYNEYFTYKRTDYFDSVYDQLSQKAYDPDTGITDGYFLGGMLAKYGSVYFFDDDFEGNFLFNEFDFLRKSEAKDKLTYMKPTPGRGWAMKEDDSPFINKKFKLMKESGEVEENISYIPKRSLYDNSKAFSKFREYNKDGSKNKDYSATLSALRDETIKMMADANKKLTNRVYTDKYLLPQITGTLYKRMKRQGWRRFHIFWEWLKEKIGLKTAENDYSEIGSDQALDLAEDILGSQYKDSDNKGAGKYPDGRQFRILPQYYTRRLLDPSSISADLVDIVLTYYHMSCGYEQRLKIKDDCETILDFIKNQSFKSNKITQFKEGVIKGDVSNTYEMADKFLEMNLYDVKRKKSTWDFKKFTLDVSKTASMVKRWTTAKNLGLNPKVAAVGFLTSMYNHIINSIVGLKYGKLNAFKSFVDVNLTVGKLLLHPRKHIVGESLSDEALIVQAEYFGIANQRERKFSGTNRPVFLNNIYRNSTYGFLSTVDFMSKSCIMKSVLRNYKYVDGKFISKDDIKMARFNLGKQGYKDMIKKYNDSSSVTLNSVLKVKDKKLYVEPKYQQAWDECKNIVRNRIQKYAEAADGMPTQLQRAAITQSWLGAFILIHRNYLPLMLQERFGNTVYDYDTQQYKNGQFALFINICYQIAQTGYIPGLTVGSIIGTAFGGPFGALIGAGIGSYITRTRSGEKKGIKDVFNSNFNDFSSEKAATKTQMNRYFAKQVIAEISTYACIVFIVNILCSYANAKSNRKKWWLQMLAYWARAFLWEAYTPYRTSDLLNNIKTPSAATSVMDVTEELANSTGSTITSSFQYLLFRTLYFNDQNSALFDPSNNVAYENSLFTKVSRGNYKGMTNFEKGVIKALPAHNLYEQVLNSKAKRLYMENQLYKGDF